MGIRLKIKLPASLASSSSNIGTEINKNKKQILQRAGDGLRQLLKKHMTELSNSRHNKLGAPSSRHFNPSDVGQAVVSNSTVSVPISTPGITRALHDIVISPREARALAIPLHRDAYGISPREYNSLHPSSSKDPKSLFFHRAKSGAATLARADKGNLVVMYLLLKSVHQSQDPSLLPNRSTINETIMKGILRGIKTVISNMS